MGKLTLTVRDYGEPPERSTVSFDGPDLTSLNFDAEIGLQNALRDATMAISIGNLTNRVTTAVESPQPDASPASPFAQRETKWLVRFRDTVTGDKGTKEIPCADLSMLDPNTTGKADLTDPAIAAFITAFEAYVLSPGSGTRGNTEVYEIVHVGRRL